MFFQHLPVKVIVLDELDEHLSLSFECIPITFKPLSNQLIVFPDIGDDLFELVCWEDLHRVNDEVFDLQRFLFAGMKTFAAPSLAVSLFTDFKSCPSEMMISHCVIK